MLFTQNPALQVNRHRGGRDVYETPQNPLFKKKKKSHPRGQRGFLSCRFERGNFRRWWTRTSGINGCLSRSTELERRTKSGGLWTEPGRQREWGSVCLSPHLAARLCQLVKRAVKTSCQSETVWRSHCAVLINKKHIDVITETTDDNIYNIYTPSLFNWASYKRK